MIRLLLCPSGYHLKSALYVAVPSCCVSPLTYIRSEMAAAVERGVLSQCCISYSRFEAAETRYVQDAIRWKKVELGTLLMEGNAVVFVCG